MPCPPALPAYHCTKASTVLPCSGTKPCAAFTQMCSSPVGGCPEPVGWGGAGQGLGGLHCPHPYGPHSPSEPAGMNLSARLRCPRLGRLSAGMGVCGGGGEGLWGAWGGGGQGDMGVWGGEGQGESGVMGSCGAQRGRGYGELWGGEEAGFYGAMGQGGPEREWGYGGYVGWGGEEAEL